MTKWRFWIDRGGTFTDLLAKRPDNSLEVHKLLSENPERYDDAVLQGIRDLMKVPAGTALPLAEIEEIRMGATVGTNALLERKGEPTLLLTTMGFRDSLLIGYQNRPEIFALELKAPEPLYSQVIEARERLNARGEILIPLDQTRLRQDLQAAFDTGLRSVAILFMHSYKNPEHEEAAGAIAREIGFTQVSLSAKTVALMKLVRRGDTTVLDAYLSPILRRYVDRLVRELGDTRLLFMQSSGGLVEAREFQGRDCLLSGPAGGVVGAVFTGRQSAPEKTAGDHKIVGFDMGGTSTDVFQYSGEFEFEWETELDGIRLQSPTLKIHTIAAGGGSILKFDQDRFQIGPESAGANPGPTSYRRGGPLTVTDANVLLGRIQPEFFPAVFGPGGNQRLDLAAVEQKFDELTARINRETNTERSREDVALGFLTVATEKMALAIKKISVQRGYDVTDYTLNSFGGAGGQHACAIAEQLGIRRVLLHPCAGVLSAYGMGLADLSNRDERQVEEELSDILLAELASHNLIWSSEAKDKMKRGQVPDLQIDSFLRAHLRYAGGDAPLEVNWQTTAHELQAEFEAAHRRRYGFIQPEKKIILQYLSLETRGRAGESIRPSPGDASNSYDTPANLDIVNTVDIFCRSGKRPTPVYRRDSFLPGGLIQGPALIASAADTVFLDSDWQALVLPDGALELSHPETSAFHADSFSRQADPTRPDPVLLEVFHNLFRSIAEEMGAILQNTAASVNIKERLDFSCALFDAGGDLVANAPHIPVHLGSMGDSVRAVQKRMGARMAPGDVFVMNDPYDGGTHLPDITVVTPVFAPSVPSETSEASEASAASATPELLFYTASRGHHADVGGITPGSMPPESDHIEQEGRLIPVSYLIKGGEFQEAELRKIFTRGELPARNVDMNLADLQAQAAANRRGQERLLEMAAHYGLDLVRRYMAFIKANAESCVRNIIPDLKEGFFALQTDRGETIQVDIKKTQTPGRGPGLRLDFAGSAPMLDNNFNTPRAVVRAAILYVFRCLVAENIPLNAGCLAPLEILLPERSMLAPEYPAAVVAGNVESSQLIVDALFGALGAMAASQGTMNNLTFGNDSFQYYETICGGAGAGPGFAGGDALQTHMTNSRLTDPEVLELRFPVLLEDFSRRRDSGGRGQFRGGDGVIRRIRFLETMTVAILSGRRRVRPHGLAGGEDGQAGHNFVERSGGGEPVIEELGPCQKTELFPGDCLVIKTPGGGGYGVASPDEGNSRTETGAEAAR